jgi:hypothetical protein
MDKLINAFKRAVAVIGNIALFVVEAFTWVALLIRGAAGAILMLLLMFLGVGAILFLGGFIWSLAKPHF